jgi:peptide deformylase
LNLVAPRFVQNCKCKDIPVSEIVDYENQTVPEMKKIMTFNLGLACPQVGIYRNMFIMRYGNEIISCYNPAWTPKSDKKALSTEGCLTYKPTRRNQKTVLRYKIIIAEFIDCNGNHQKLKLRGMDSIVFQHESDHLIGITIFNKEN